MSSKAVKAQLKAAKAAVGRKEYQEVSRICQVRLFALCGGVGSVLIRKDRSAVLSITVTSD